MRYESNKSPSVKSCVTAMCDWLLRVVRLTVPSQDTFLHCAHAEVCPMGVSGTE